MYAILKHGGHQYRVAPGDRLLVDRLIADVGSKVTLEPVLLVADGDAIADVGAGAVSGAHVVATVIAHRRGRKLRVFTYKPKKRTRRTLGHRSQLTELLVDEVAPGGGKPAARREEKPAAAAKTAAKTAASPPAAAAADAEPASDAEAVSKSEVLDAPVDAPPAKRASRPRRKADGA
jgi:large subunit ribosomal protein L21